MFLKFGNIRRETFVYLQLLKKRLQRRRFSVSIGKKILSSCFYRISPVAASNGFRKKLFLIILQNILRKICRNKLFLTRIFPYKGRMYNIVLIQEKTALWKPILLHILLSGLLKKKLNSFSKLSENSQVFPLTIWYIALKLYGILADSVIRISRKPRAPW